MSNAHRSGRHQAGGHGLAALGGPRAPDTSAEAIAQLGQPAAPRHPRHGPRRRAGAVCPARRSDATCASRSRSRRPTASRPEPMPAPFAQASAARPACTCTGRRPTRLFEAEWRAVAGGATQPARAAPLPDRWVVLRVVAPAGATASARHRAGCIEADTANADPGSRSGRRRARHAARGKTVARPSN